LFSIDAVEKDNPTDVEENTINECNEGRYKRMKGKTLSKIDRLFHKIGIIE
jgi:hypothetical protein